MYHKRYTACFFSCARRGRGDLRLNFYQTLGHAPFRAGSRCVLNFFQANGLSPSGGHILSSPAKKEYGKKDAAQGGVFPALRTHPLGWVSGVRVVMFRLPGRFASASVPCERVSRPLAASLLLTHCGGDLMDFFGAGSLCVLFFPMQ